MQRTLLKKSIVVIGIILFLFSLLGNIYIINVKNDDEGNSYYENLRPSKVSGKIHIDNNWTSTKSAGICTGFGTYAQPYLIEDLRIFAGTWGPCILIENSNAYFRIENCSLSGSQSGIRLINSINGVIVENDVKYNAIGISIAYCEDIMISENDATQSDLYGIYLIFSNDIIVSSNKASNNKYTGIEMEECIGCNISDNIVRYNDNYDWSMGITLESCTDTVISGNTVSNNRAIGISLRYCSGSIVSENTVSSNDKGLNLQYSHNNKVKFNTIEGNGIGIYLEESNNNEISNNSFSGNTIDFQGYVDPKLIFLLIVIGLSVIAFGGIIFFTRRRSAKAAEIQVPVILNKSTIISSSISLAGGIISVWSGFDLPSFAPIPAIFFGILAIIGSILGIKSQLPGSIICLVGGSASLYYNYYYMFQHWVYLIGIVLIMIGSISVLVLTSNKKKKLVSVINTETG